MRHYCTTATSHAPPFHVKVCFCFLSCLFNHPMLDSNNSKNEKSRMSNIQPGIFHCIFKYRYLLKYYVDVDIWILSTDIYSQCVELPTCSPATRHVISASHLSPVRAAVRVIIPSIWRGEAHWLELIVITSVSTILHHRHPYFIYEVIMK